MATSGASAGRTPAASGRAPSSTSSAPPRPSSPETKAETADVRRGRLAQIDPDKTCDELFDYWLDKRALHKRSPAGWLVVQLAMRAATKTSSIPP